MTPHVLVHFDGGQASRNALIWAAGLQRSMHGLSIHVVQIVEPGLQSGENSVRLLERALAQSVHDLGAIATTEVIASNTPGPAIVEAAKGLGSDVIVLSGASGREPAAAEYVRHHPPCVVVTFKDEQAPAVSRVGFQPSA
jgi:nucleotide-binding universal stress UspA family protein